MAMTSSCIFIKKLRNICFLISYLNLKTGPLILYKFLKEFGASYTEKLDEGIEESSDKSSEETTESKSVLNKRKKNDRKQAMKRFKAKPNFFIAVPVNDSGIHQKVKKLQEKLIVKNPVLFPALVPVSTLHITLAVTYLANDTEIKIVKDKLDDWAAENIKTYFEEPCILSFNGVKTFQNTVAYVDVEQCKSYEKICDISKHVKDLLSSAGFSVNNEKFIPHLTFLKLSKDFKLLRLKKRFKDDFESLKECNEHFGKQEINHLQLLSMNTPKDDFGYYKCFHQIKVSDATIDMNHTECCSPILKPKNVGKIKTENVT